MKNRGKTQERKPRVTIPHFRKVGGSTKLIVEGKPFIMLAGEVHNSSSSSLEYMREIWRKLAAMNLNTAIVPVSWELVEPAEGRFNWRLVDGLIRGARAHNLRLVFLWFGTWKNAMSDYPPEWVKADLERFPRSETEPGKRISSITALSSNAREADAKAFAAFMRRVRALDGRLNTVLAVQVENESGLLGAPRDRCPLAEEAFRRPVPEKLLLYMQTNRDALRPELKSAWESTGARTEGNWAEVFGNDADEVFMAWHTASYVEAVARAGKAEYPLPMFANAWLVQRDDEPPGSYPSGGPVSRMFDPWKAAAPSLDSLAPDIYRPDFSAVCADYSWQGNPLLIPEASRGIVAAGNAFCALGRHDALCFSPFGIEGVADGRLLGKSYELLAQLTPLVTRFQGTGRMTGFVQSSPALAGDEAQEIPLGGYRLRVTFPAPAEGRPPGGGLAISVADDEFYIAGHGFRMEFLPREGDPQNVEFMSLDEGVFKNGRWVPGRRLNGDERTIRIGTDERAARIGGEAAILKARLHSFA